jgi:site-specific DNA recombinase
VIKTIAMQLAEPLGLIETLGLEPESPGVMGKLLERIKQLRNELSKIDHDQYETVRGLIERVEISAGQIILSISAADLRNILVGDNMKIDPETSPPIKVTVPFAKARIGKSRKLILAPDGVPEPVLDQTMILAIARARQWFDLLASDSTSTISNLARAANKPRSWVSAQLSLAFLAPDIVTTILQGRQPLTMSLKPLLKIATGYHDWSEQTAAFERG